MILVDNAPSSDATERLVRSRYGERIRYVREPAPGLSRARNRGLTLDGADTPRERHFAWDQSEV